MYAQGGTKLTHLSTYCNKYCIMSVYTCLNGHVLVCMSICITADRRVCSGTWWTTVKAELVYSILVHTGTNWYILVHILLNLFTLGGKPGDCPEGRCVQGTSQACSGHSSASKSG